MSQPSLDSEFREAILSFVWRQWGQLGIFTSIAHADLWCQDPEALLLFSLEVTRYEPRMFDEILDWIAVAGADLMRQRLTNVLRLDAGSDVNLVSAALTCAGLAPLVTGTSQDIIANTGARCPVFRGPYEALANVTAQDEVFAKHDLRRPPFRRSGKSQAPSLAKPINLAFRLRAIFGASTRAEAIRCLLMRPGREHGTAEVATLAALSRVGVQQALNDLARAGVCESAQRGRKDLIWWIEGGPWQAWLGLSPELPPRWVDWLGVYRGLTLLWRWFHAPDRLDESPYIRASRARDAMDEAKRFLVNRGLSWKPSPAEGFKGAEYWDVFVQDVRALIAVLD